MSNFEKEFAKKVSQQQENLDAEKKWLEFQKRSTLERSSKNGKNGESKHLLFLLLILIGASASAYFIYQKIPVIYSSSSEVVTSDQTNTRARNDDQWDVDQLINTDVDISRQKNPYVDEQQPIHRDVATADEDEDLSSEKTNTNTKDQEFNSKSSNGNSAENTSKNVDNHDNPEDPSQKHLNQLVKKKTDDSESAWVKERYQNWITSQLQSYLPMYIQDVDLSEFQKTSNHIVSPCRLKTNMFVSAGYVEDFVNGKSSRGSSGSPYLRVGLELAVSKKLDVGIGLGYKIQHNQALNPYEETVSGLDSNLILRSVDISKYIIRTHVIELSLQLNRHINQNLTFSLGLVHSWLNTEYDLIISPRPQTLVNEENYGDSFDLMIPFNLGINAGLAYSLSPSWDIEFLVAQSLFDLREPVWTTESPLFNFDVRIGAKYSFSL